jgi:hypothetical protein
MNEALETCCPRVYIEVLESADAVEWSLLLDMWVLSPFPKLAQALLRVSTRLKNERMSGKIVTEIPRPSEWVRDIRDDGEWDLRIASIPQVCAMFAEVGPPYPRDWSVLQRILPCVEGYSAARVVFAVE